MLMNYEYHGDCSFRTVPFHRKVNFSLWGSIFNQVCFPCGLWLLLIAAGVNKKTGQIIDGLNNVCDPEEKLN